MPRLLTLMLLFGLLAGTIAPCLAKQPDVQMPTMPCKSAILTLGPVGDQRLAHYADGHGHRIDLWCTRRVFISRYDLRIATTNGTSAAEDSASPVPALTVGGCFFAEGDNQGPFIFRKPDGAFAKVEWINKDPSHRNQYKFSYDFGTRLVTITATTNGCAPLTKIVSPQPSFKKMLDALPDLPGGACASGSGPGPLDP